MGIQENLSSFSKSITSPAKLAFAGYVLLAYVAKIQTSRCEFLIIAASFFLMQVVHDDYLRIRLNRSAEHWLRRNAELKAAIESIKTIENEFPDLYERTQADAITAARKANERSEQT